MYITTREEVEGKEMVVIKNGPFIGLSAGFFFFFFFFF